MLPGVVGTAKLRHVGGMVPFTVVVHAAVAGLALLGCASSAARPDSPAGPPPEEAAAYFPLETGWKWAYELDKDGQSMLATYAVLEPVQGTVIVQAGEQRLGYVVTPQGIARRDGVQVGDLLLKTPIRAGLSWPVEGGDAKVVSVGETVTVPAGVYPNCATIEETRRDPLRVVRTVYAAGTGPISVEQQVADPATGKFKVVLRAKLLGVTRPGEDPLGAPPQTGGPRP